MLVTIIIDGKTYEVPEDTNLLQACLQLGLDLPYFCWHPAMGSVGSCRQCAVQQYADENDERGRIVMACMTPITPDMRISIQQESVKQFRETSIEVIMANHPHDCPVCEEGGECHLQDMTLMSGHNTRDYRGKKKTYQNQDLGPCIGHEMNRCISCYRCIRFYNDYAGGSDLQAMASRENVYYGRHSPGTLESPFSGNLVEVCPTGVFTDKPFGKRYTRKWDLQSAPSVCTHCSLGCNTSPNERYGKIKRVVSRYHDQVNGYFLCDRGRFGYEFNNIAQRPIDYALKLSDNGYSTVSQNDFWVALQSYLTGASSSKESNSDLIGIGSPLASVEENQLLKSIVGAENYFAGVTDNELSLLNQIVAMYQSEACKSASLKQLEQSDAIIIIGEDLIHTAPMMALSVRQASRNQSYVMAEENRIPLWQDAAIRTLAQDQCSPIIQLNAYSNDLDDISQHVVNDVPEKLVNILNDLTQTILGEKALHGTDSTFLNQVSGQLVRANMPCVIAGTSLGSIELLQAAQQLIQALNQVQNKKISVALVPKDVNSLGMVLSQPKGGVQSFVRQLGHCSPKTIISLKTDLYEADQQETLNALLQHDHRLLVIGDQVDRTQQQADFFIPAATVFETEGSFINNEGRVQRFFAVYNGKVQDTWRSLVQIQKIVSATSDGSTCKNFDDVVALCGQQQNIFKCLSRVAPNARFNRNGLKVPRQSHRYSGRTSMNAGVQIHEPMQTVDMDSGLAFSMEGVPLYQPSPLNSNNWSPGWNSNEALHRFQQEINGPLIDAAPQVLILESSPKLSSPIDTDLLFIQKAGKVKKGQVLAFRKPQIFGSDTASSNAACLQERFESAAIGIHPDTANLYELKDRAHLIFKPSKTADSEQLIFTIQRDERLPVGIITIPDLPQVRAQMCLAMLPARVKLKVAIGNLREADANESSEEEVSKDG